MLDDLAQDTTVATTNDEDFLGVRVRVHSKMGDHLLVAIAQQAKRVSPNTHLFEQPKKPVAQRNLRKFITLSTLYNIVQN